MRLLLAWCVAAVFAATATQANGGPETRISPQQVFFHEYAHHLQLWDARSAIPTWAVEGFAEFFASAEINKDGSVTIGKNPPYRWIHDRSSLPVEQMVGETYG